jgi:hypothetical protein
MGRQRSRGSKPHRPWLEALEDRRTPAQFGVPWHDAYHLAVSFVPDGTLLGAQRSDLFQTLNTRMPTAVWQREILRAFQTWAIHAHINFSVKDDGGQPLGVPGPDQADPRFGDIRIGAVPMSPEVLSISVPHDPFLSGTWSGDVLLNSAALDDSGADLFPILLHEVGHVLGVDHNPDPASVMFSHLEHPQANLSPGDVAAVGALYTGPRPSDPNEWPGWYNETMETANPISAPLGYDGTTPLLAYADITTHEDVDFFSWSPLADSRGPVTIRLQTAGVSLLAPHLIVHDSSGRVLGDVAAASDFGDTVEVQLPGVDPKETYFLEVRGATSDVFGIGEYALAVSDEARSTIGPDQLDTVIRQTYTYLAPEDINAIFLDPRGALFNVDHHADDSFEAAVSLMPARGYGSEAPIRTTASLGDPGDVDFYQVEAPGVDSGAPPVMTVTVRATEVNGLQPRATVFDANRNPLPALVLAHGDGTYTIQITGARPDTEYVVRVGSDPTSGKVVGNYDLDVVFGQERAEPVTFVSSSLEGPIRRTSYDLVVNQAQLFDFLLAASAAEPAPGAAVRMTIVDGQGRVVASRTAGVGDTAGGDPVLLMPGVYRATFSSVTPDGARSSRLAFRLFGASLSDPIGPALEDPTLRPVTALASGDPAAPFPPAAGASGSPYTWLALGLGDTRGAGTADRSARPLDPSSLPDRAAVLVGLPPQGRLARGAGGGDRADTPGARGPSRVAGGPSVGDLGVRGTVRQGGVPARDDIPWGPGTAAEEAGPAGARALDPAAVLASDVIPAPIPLLHPRDPRTDGHVVEAREGQASVVEVRSPGALHRVATGPQSPGGMEVPDAPVPSPARGEAVMSGLEADTAVLTLWVAMAAIGKETHWFLAVSDGVGTPGRSGAVPRPVPATDRHPRPGTRPPHGRARRARGPGGVSSTSGRRRRQRPPGRGCRRASRD